MIRTKEGASTRNLSFTIEPAIPLQIRFAILRQISSRLRSCTFEYTPSARLIFIASERERSTASSRIFVSFTGLVAAGGTGDASRRSGEAGLKWKGRDARDENHAEPRKRRGLVRGAFAEGEDEMARTGGARTSRIPERREGAEVIQAGHFRIFINERNRPVTHRESTRFNFDSTCWKAFIFSGSVDEAMI